MRGKLIIIEAGDGCGKATQADALYARLKQDGRRVRKVAFPDYESQSSALIKLYLNGAFGSRPDDVNAFAASTFYAVDRYASYQSKWKSWYESGGIVIADRYTTSNMVHQGLKFADREAREAYLTWLCDLEFSKMGLPAPDAVVFLEMAPEISAKLIAARAEETQTAKDIHERDQVYLSECHRVYCELAETYGWHIVRCAERGALKSVERIHAEVYQAVSPYL